MSKLHKNIEKPEVPFSALPKKLQETVRAMAKVLVDEKWEILALNEDISDPVESTIELIEVGLIRIVEYEDGIGFDIFDFEKGEYKPIPMGSRH